MRKIPQIVRTESASFIVPVYQLVVSQPSFFFRKIPRDSTEFHVQHLKMWRMKFLEHYSYWAVLKTFSDLPLMG